MRGDQTCSSERAVLSSDGFTSMPVDLRLASTYVPAITCILRTTVLVVVISRYVPAIITCILRSTVLVVVISM
jgi:hypothetical protein